MQKTFRFNLAAVAVLSGLLCSVCLAQVPGTLLPGQAERQFEVAPQPRAQSGQFLVPPSAQKLPPKAAATRFVLNSLVVLGSTIYDEATLASTYSAYLGKEVSLVDLYEIAQALTVRYRNDGYILSRVVVPAQVIEAGAVRLEAVEGFIAGSAYNGDVQAAGGLVEAYAEKIRQSQPLEARVLERYLLLTNDLPGAFARGTLSPSKSQAGASDLTVDYIQRRFSGDLRMDNRGSKALGPTRLFANLDLNSLWGMGERTGVRFSSSGSEELNFFSLSHEQPLGSEGARLRLEGSVVHAQPEELGLTIVPLDLETSSASSSLTVSYPMLRSRVQNLYLRGSLGLYNGESKLFDVRETRDRLRTMRLGATYDLADSSKGVNIVDVELSWGIDGLGASRNADPDLSRAAGKVDFTKLAIYAARLQSLAPSWSMLVAANGQYAFSDLLAPELFSHGGEQFGRGYDPSELVGDHGASVKLELRYSGNVSLSSASMAYTAYGFYDIGVVNQRTPAGGKSTESAASAGVGVRNDFGGNLHGFLEIAKPLTRTVAIEGDKNLRAYFGLSMSF